MFVERTTQKSKKKKKKKKAIDRDAVQRTHWGDAGQTDQYHDISGDSDEF